MATKNFQPSQPNTRMISPGIVSHPSLTNPSNLFEDFWIITKYGICLLNRSKKEGENIDPNLFSAFISTFQAFFDVEIKDKVQTQNIDCENHIYYAVSMGHCIFIGKSKHKTSKNRFETALRQISEDFMEHFGGWLEAIKNPLNLKPFQLYNSQLDDYFSNEHYVSRLAKKATKSVSRKVIDIFGGLPGKLLGKIGGKIRRF